jgi:hypothetical protein
MVRYSNEVRDSFMTGDVDHMLNYYKSLKVFDKLAHDPQNRILYKLKEGKKRVVPPPSCILMLAFKIRLSPEQE